MELRRTLTGGLAWAGLVIVVAVPTVEAVRSKLVHDGAGTAQTVAEIEAPSPIVVPAAPIIAKKAADFAVAPVAAADAAPTVAVSSLHVAPAVATAPVRVAVATAPEAQQASAPKSSPLPAAVVAAAAPVAPTPVRADSGKDTALDQYLATGKPLPSYIKTAPTPADVASTPASTDTQQSKPAAALPTEMASTGDSVTTPPTEATTAAIAPPVPMPVAARPKIAPPQRLVTEADLKGWKSGSLADYLRQRGLLSASDDEAGSSN